jgi:hypothetical protein
MNTTTYLLLSEKQAPLSSDEVTTIIKELISIQQHSYVMNKLRRNMIGQSSVKSVMALICIVLAGCLCGETP